MQEESVTGTSGTRRAIRRLLVAGLAAWGLWAGWQVYQARRAGRAISEQLQAKGPASEGSATAARRSLADAAEELARGRFRAATEALAPAPDLSRSQLQKAKGFLRRRVATRARLIAAASAAEKRQQGETSLVRAALARALASAARDDERGVEKQLAAAESTLDGLAPGTRLDDWPADEAAIAARVAQLEPAVRLGRELLAESQAAPRRLIRRAAWHYQSREYATAAALLELAAQLAAAPRVDRPPSEVPEWFVAMAEPPPATADANLANSAVKLAEAVAQAESPGTSLRTLVDKARRHLDAEQQAEAWWWAATALAALALDPEAVVIDGSVGEDPAP